MMISCSYLGYKFLYHVDKRKSVIFLLKILHDFSIFIRNISFKKYFNYQGFDVVMNF